MHTTRPRVRSDRPGYVVYGLDQHDHTRAAWFSPREQHVARMASNMAGFYLFEPSLKISSRLEVWLPRGSRLESGRFVVPRVRQGLYQKICDLEEVARSTAACSNSADEASGSGNDADLTTADKTETLERLVAILRKIGDSEPEQD